MYIKQKLKSGFVGFIQLTLIYKFINIFITTYHYLSDYNKIGEFFYGDTFRKLIKQYVNLELSKDWIGRLYGIINPMLDIDGNLNVNNMIIEIDGAYTNNNEQVKNWIYKQLNLIGELFKLHNLYNYINMSIERVGPINGDNFLIVFDIASRKQMSKNFKSFVMQLLFYCIIALILYVAIF